MEHPIVFVGIGINKLINLCEKSLMSKELGVKISVKNPVIWLMEVLQNGE